jgi:hypothetical protein
MNRQKKILAGCLALLVLAGLYAWQQTPRSQRAEIGSAPPRATAPARRNTPAVAQVVEQEARLRLELLERRNAAFPGYRRDLFGALFTAPVGQPPAPPAPPMPTRPPELEVLAPPVQSVVVAPRVHFDVLGFVVVDGSKTVFLDQDGEIFVAREGQVFGDDYRVIELSEEYLVIDQPGQSQPIILSVPKDGQAPAKRSATRPRRGR